MQRLEADVCVVGAGFAGMSAAWRLRQAGREVVVLEARDRVGGRSWTEYLPDGTHIDRGCGWIGAGHEHAYGLAREMGIDTYPTWFEGEHIVVNDGKPARYTGTIPRSVSPLQLASLGLAFTRLEPMARKVPRDAPWTAKKARKWDNRTLGDWLESATRPGIGREMLRTTLGDIFTSDLAEVSLLGALHMLNSNRGLERLVNIEDGHQESRVVGGTQAILNRVHERLGDAVRLSSPVRGVSQREGQRRDRLERRQRKGAEGGCGGAPVAVRAHLVGSAAAARPRAAHPAGADGRGLEVSLRLRHAMVARGGIERTVAGHEVAHAGHPRCVWPQPIAGDPVRGVWRRRVASARQDDP